MVHGNSDDLLIGVFHDCRHAEEAVEDLLGSGFGDDQVQAALCDAELFAREEPADDRETPPFGPVRLIALALIGGLLGALAMGWVPGSGLHLDALFYLGLLGGLAAGGCLGAALFLVLAQGRLEEDAPHGGMVHVSKGIVAVRTEGRSELAAEILMRHAGCEVQAGAGRVPGRRR